MNIVNLIIIFNCILLLYLFINLKSNEKFAVYIPSKKDKKIINESFDSKEHLIIKKTNIYNLVYSNAKINLYVWEPKPIDNFFPVGQIVTKTKQKPNHSAILVRSKKDNKPKSYQLIKVLDNKKYSIWKPIPEKGYGVVSYIFSKTMPPSIYRIRMIESKFLERSSVGKFINESNLNIYNIQFSHYFISSPNNNVKKIESYFIPGKNMKPEKKIVIENTVKYKKLWNNKNKHNNKFISIWRPIPSQDFKSLGDIVLNSDEDPNNNLQTPTVHKDFVKPILYFRPPITYKTDKENIKFWNAKTYDGYVTLGQVMSFDKEPSADVIFSLAIEYLEISDLQNIWNSIGVNENNINIWATDNLFLKAVKGIEKPNENIYKLNNTESFVNFEVDPLDISMNAIIYFNKIKQNINKNNLIKLLKRKLASKIDISESRIEIKNIDTDNSKITINVRKRQADSMEKLTNKALEELYDIISKYKIVIKDNASISLILNDLTYTKEEPKIEENFKNEINSIKLNNSEWKKNFS